MPAQCSESQRMEPMYGRWTVYAVMRIGLVRLTLMSFEYFSSLSLYPLGSPPMERSSLICGVSGFSPLPVGSCLLWELVGRTNTTKPHIATREIVFALCYLLDMLMGSSISCHLIIGDSM